LDGADSSQRTGHDRLQNPLVSVIPVADQVDRDARSVGQDKLAVLFINTATLPPLGADTWVHGQVMANLDRESHELHAACVTGRPDDPTPTYRMVRQIPDVHVRPVNFGPERTDRSRRGRIRTVIATLPIITSILGLAVYIRRRRISIIHTSDRPRDAFASVLLGRLTRTPSIIHAHVAWDTWMSPLLRWSLRNADGLIAISEFVGQSLVESGHAPEKVHVVRNAVDVDRWEPGRDRAEKRAQLGLADDDPMVLTVCRLFPEKGPEDLIRAVTIARDKVPNVRLLVVGRDPTPNQWFSARLADVVRDGDLGETVQLLGWRDDVVRLMAAADIYAMPSTGEPFGLVFAEAMAMKLPVVGLNDGGTPEVVEDGRSGLLSDRGDTDALAANLVNLLENPARRREMGEYGRRRVEACFTTDRLAREIAEVYRRIAS
jgi:glycosyltransferase involved in cell wall biosynthesis